MKSLSWLGLASLALLVSSCAPSIYSSGSPNTSPYYQATNFNGDWRLVAARSDNRTDWIDERNRFDPDDWGFTQGSSSYSGMSDRYRWGAWFLPDQIRIEGDDQALQIQDVNGNSLAEIDVNNGYQYGSYNNYQGNMRAHWINQQRFQVERDGRNGRRITQTFTLRDRGRQLVVNTQVDRDGRLRSFTRLYERV